MRNSEVGLRNYLFEPQFLGFKNYHDYCAHSGKKHSAFCIPNSAFKNVLPHLAFRNSHSNYSVFKNLSIVFTALSYLSCPVPDINT
jgi:hypothetical protein